MTRVSVFIDGGNFFEGLHAQGFSTDLFYRRLMASLAEVEEAYIGDIFFYMARYPDGPYPNKCAAQQTYFDRLADEGITVVPGKTEVRDGMFIEREVEAALATDLVTGAWSGLFDEALVVSRRAAFVPAVAAAKQAGRIIKTAFFRYTIDPIDGLEGVSSSSRAINALDIIRHTRSGPIPKGVHAQHP